MPPTMEQGIQQMERRLIGNFRTSVLKLPELPVIQQLAVVCDLIEQLNKEENLRNIFKQAIEQNEQSGTPPLEAGRKRHSSQSRQIDKAWYCLEEVPCGKKGCRKEQDLHGPYWYRYERNGQKGRWTSRYLGADDPFEGLDSLEDKTALLKEVKQLERIGEPTEVDAVKAEQLLERLAPFSGKKIAIARTHLEELNMKFQQNQEVSMRMRFGMLTAKQRTGDRLLESEREELYRIGAVLAVDH